MPITHTTTPDSTFSAEGRTEWLRAHTLPTADEITFTPSGTGASSRTAQAKLRERVTPEDFGAAGDGTTDDTTSLANALASGAYRLDGAPGATYLISQRLAIGSSNMWLAGNGAILKLKDSTVSTLTNGSMLYANQKTDLVIEGWLVDGNKANNDINDNFGDGMRIQDCQRVKVRNNRVYNTPRDGISILRQIGGDGNDDIAVTDNVVTGAGAASQTTGGEGIIVTEGEWITVTGNTCRGNLLRGVDIETLSTTITNLVVNNNICDGNSNAGISINGATDGTVVGNVCSDNTTHGINLEAGAGVDAQLTVTGNKCSGSTNGIHVKNYQNCNITGNVLHTNTTQVLLEGTNTGTRIRQNTGYVTENSGTATIASGNTSVVITHGLSITPTLDDISVIFGEQGTSDYGRFWISTITSTQFTINVSADPGASNLDLAWRAAKVTAL